MILRLAPLDLLKFYFRTIAIEIYSKKLCEVKITLVENLAGIRLIVNPDHGLTAVVFGICDYVEYRYLPGDGNLGMDFDARLFTAEECPAENRHTEVDGCRIDSVESSMKFKLPCDSSSLSKRYHIEGEVLEVPMLAEHVGFGKRVPDDCQVAETKQIAPFGMSHSNVCEFSECAASYRLSENEDKQVIPI